MKYTITDLRKDFPDEAACLEWLKDYLYPDGITCKNCKKITPHHAMRTRKSYSCELCGHHVHPTADTIFHKSRTPLTLWFEAIYLMAATRSCISAKQLERTLGVTYKTAWRMFHQIRKTMADDGEIFKGDVEIDESYLHPDTSKRTTAKPYQNQILLGMVERGGKVKIQHVPKAGVNMLPIIMGSVAMSANVYTDQYLLYKTLWWKGYKHQSVKHSEGIYVRGNVHTQNIENVWSHLKRGIKGVYRHVDAQYLQAYADEYAFRYSHRKSPSMFWALMDRVSK